MVGRETKKKMLFIMTDIANRNEIQRNFPFFFSVFFKWMAKIKLKIKFFILNKKKKKKKKSKLDKGEVVQ